MSECTSGSHFTGCVLTSTTETESVSLSTITLSGQANKSLSLMFPLTSTAFYVSDGTDTSTGSSYTWAPDIAMYSVTTFVVRSTTPNALPADKVTIGYWTSTGDVVWQPLQASELQLTPLDEPG